MGALEIGCFLGFLGLLLGLGLGIRFGWQWLALLYLAGIICGVFTWEAKRRRKE